MSSSAFLSEDTFTLNWTILSNRHVIKNGLYIVFSYESITVKIVDIKD